MSETSEGSRDISSPRSRPGGTSTSRLMTEYVQKTRGLARSYTALESKCMFNQTCDWNRSLDLLKNGRRPAFGAAAAPSRN